MKQALFNLNGEKTERTVELSERVFGQPLDKHAIYLEIKRYLAAQRQGTHKTKEKSEIAASTRKIQRQKGTGNARKGSVKATNLRGGGTTFGPRPRNYAIKLNQAQKKIGKRGGLSEQCRKENLLLLDQLPSKSFKTKELVQVLKKLNLLDTKILFVLHETNRSLQLAARNLPGVTTRSVRSLCLFDILHADKIVCAPESIAVLNEQLA